MRLEWSCYHDYKVFITKDMSTMLYYQVLMYASTRWKKTGKKINTNKVGMLTILVTFMYGNGRRGLCNACLSVDGLILSQGRDWKFNQVELGLVFLGIRWHRGSVTTKSLILYCGTSRPWSS